MVFRKLEAREIDARIATIRADGLTLLLYKDARVDQNILDETVGAENWQRSHELIGGNLYCTVSIWDANKNMWISKQDVGTESYTEKEKGQASDSFKRACFNWGIGRELYTAPFIWIKAGDANITEKQGKAVCNERFEVTGISYDADGNINYLKIANAKSHKVVYQLGCEQQNEIIGDKEKMIIERMLTDKGYEVKEIFPEGLNLTWEQYTQAVKNIQVFSRKGKK